MAESAGANPVRAGHGLGEGDGRSERRRKKGQQVNVGPTFWIPYTSRDFPGGTVASGGTLGADWDDLVWAALTVGRPNTAYVLRHGEASFYEALFRVSLVRMAVEQRPYDQSLFRTAAFRGLDPTEKGAVSYFLGMAVCKLFADTMLGTPWLLHLDVFRDQLDPEVVGGRSRPDLVGVNHFGDWHAFECKGRSTVPKSDERRKAKVQAERLTRVNSKDCVLHVGAISYFRQEKLEFHWRDPEPEPVEKLQPLSVELTEDAWRHYYAPALALESDGGSIAMSDARAATDVEIEIRADVRERLLGGEWSAARMRAYESRESLQEDGFRADGLRVRAGESWRQGRETVTPGDR